MGDWVDKILNVLHGPFGLDLFMIVVDDVWSACSCTGTEMLNKSPGVMRRLSSGCFCNVTCTLAPLAARPL